MSLKETVERIKAARVSLTADTPVGEYFEAPRWIELDRSGVHIGALRLVKDTYRVTTYDPLADQLALDLNALLKKGVTARFISPGGVYLIDPDGAYRSL